MWGYLGENGDPYIWLITSPRAWGPSVWQIFNNQPLTDLSIPLPWFGITFYNSERQALTKALAT